MRSVLIAASHSTAGRTESTVPMPAILQKDMVIAMPHEMLMREAKYQSSMRMFRSLLDKGIITQEDYFEAEHLMREKYHPLLGTLFADIALT